MWRPPINFFTLHYAYILCAALLSFVIIVPHGNVPAVDSFFFGASGSTESGLNTFDVKDLKTYQQLVIYFIPIITHMVFVNILVMVVRLYWFERRIAQSSRREAAAAAAASTQQNVVVESSALELEIGNEGWPENISLPTLRPKDEPLAEAQTNNQSQRIKFAPDVHQPGSATATVYGTARDRGDQGDAVPTASPPQYQSDDEDGPQTSKSTAVTDTEDIRRVGRRSRSFDRGLNFDRVPTIDRVATSMFVLGRTQSRSRSREPGLHRVASAAGVAASVAHTKLPTVTLSKADKDRLGGIEYRALKLLIKICTGYFFGLHLFGVICLLPWIINADAKYKAYLDSVGQNWVWWAFYSAQTMVDNLGFTLTPDSMIQFRDATWPMLVMTFLAFAGYNFFPVFLRLIIWTYHEILRLWVPKSSTRESLRYLLDHPRRCSMLLFPARQTWILLGILVLLNVIDVLFLIVLDLDNESVTVLPLGPRILAALFQAASSRHTGTSTFNLAELNPAAQFSLLVMMYISVFPIAMSIRSSNAYDDSSLGKFAPETVDPDDANKGSGYMMTHVRNQLSFDLWYIFLGIFLICIAESAKIRDNDQPEFTIFTIFFEVTSAYGNVGLSLGHPAVMTSLCGQFSAFGKVVICAMMIRGRHRGLPYELDRAIQLPGDSLENDPETQRQSERLLTQDQ